MGGMVTTNNKPFAISGLVVLDFANWQWENITTAGFYSASCMAFDGSAYFVPIFGTERLIVMISGTASSSSRTFQVLRGQCPMLRYSIPVNKSGIHKLRVEMFLRQDGIFAWLGLRAPIKTHMKCEAAPAYSSQVVLLIFLIEQFHLRRLDWEF
jgi:hypothetical protein